MSAAPRAARTTTHDSPARRVIADIGAASGRRHSIPAWFEADLTHVLRRLHENPDTSLTLFVAATLARAVARHPRVHGVRDLRGRIVVFDDVDVNMSVEVTVDGRPFPMNHVLRRVHARSVADLAAEVRRVKADPAASPTSRMAGPLRAYLAIPAPLRTRLLGAVHRLPDRQKALMGTVGLTSVGMFGRGGGLGIPFLVHTLDVLVGGLATRPGYDEAGEVGPRTCLAIALVADHDVVDGAPLARFMADLRAALESGDVLDEESEAPSEGSDPRRPGRRLGEA